RVGVRRVFHALRHDPLEVDFELPINQFALLVRVLLLDAELSIVPTQPHRDNTFRLVQNDPELAGQERILNDSHLDWRLPGTGQPTFSYLIARDPLAVSVAGVGLA